MMLGSSGVTVNVAQFISLTQTLSSCVTKRQYWFPSKPVISLMFKVIVSTPEYTPVFVSATPPLDGSPKYH